MNDYIRTCDRCGSPLDETDTFCENCGEPIHITSEKNEPILVKEREVVKEVVKIKCGYCGKIYDQKEDKCPHCGGH